MQVTAASRRAEPLAAAAAALSVLTDDELHRTGVTNLADALRYIPGMDVARIDGNTWGVTARGFNSSTSNKLLVMMDGRSIYTPLFSGVFWDAQDTMLQDIDRIEVVRGPGAAMWGANAVNGVISISTKSAQYTQGGLFSAGAGTEESHFASARYGGEVPGKFYYRVYGKTFRRDDLVFRSGQDSKDSETMSQGGFRVDAEIAPTEGSVTVQGDYYDGRLGTMDPTLGIVGGGNLLARATRKIDDRAEIRTQIYFDHLKQFVPKQFGEVRNTVDIDTQGTFTFQNQELLAGFNYRSSADRTRSDASLTFDPTARRINIASGFLQDEIKFFQDRLSLIVGSRFEYHDSIGIEVQPSVRAAWRTPHGTAWAAVSRAVRSPTRFDEDLRFKAGNFVLTRGNPNFLSEKLIAYEAGFRSQPLPSVSYDISTYYNRYHDLRSQERFSGPTRIFENKLLADTYGVEASAKWQVIKPWRLQVNYTYLHEKFSHSATSTDVTNGTQEANDPREIATVMSSLDFLRHWQLDTSLRHVSSLQLPAQRGYLVGDIRLAWYWPKHWEFSVVGQNLLDKRHPEFGENTPTSREVQRSVYGSVTWEF